MASMTRAELRSELIRQARIGSNVATAVLDGWIYEAVKTLQKDTKWLEKTRYYYVREYFSIGTNEGFGVRLSAATGTNLIVRVATAQTDKGGTSFAEMLSTALVTLASGTRVSFSTASFKFGIDISSNASTGFIIGPPDYDSTAAYSACYKLFGIENSASVSNTTYTGSIAPWCTSEYPLPTDFYYVKEVRYGEKKYVLMPIIYKGRDYNTGVPTYYYIRGGRLGLVPQPTDGGAAIQLDYYHIPADFTGDSVVHPFDEICNYALIYYASYLYKLHQEDNTNMLKFRNLYEAEKMKINQLKSARVGGAIDMFGRGRGYDPRRYPTR
jgi:hypothetical protein